MPWNDQSGGSGQGGGGPWGGGPRRPNEQRPWGEQPPRPPAGGGGPDLEELLRRFRERMGGGGRGGGGPMRGGRDPRGLRWPVMAGILFFGWLLTGVYVVDEGRAGVITQFGNYNRTSAPGIHWHLPPPFESRQVINVTGQQVAEIGFTTDGRQATPTMVDRPEESLMITGDRNIVEIHFRAYFNVSNPVNYVFNVRDPNEAVRAVAESAMREVIGRGQLETIITTERGEVEVAVEQLMQQVLDEYQSGVNVLQVQLLSASAPATVIEAFNDVVNAGSEAQTIINDANRETARIVNEAQAYRERVVREATGEAERFISVHGEYRQAPQVTRDRLYLETMERVFREADTMVIDQRGGAVPYLPLDGMVQRRPRAGAQQQTQPQAAEGR